MKQIEITDKHREKIFEMCRKLFPEIKKPVFLSFDVLLFNKSGKEWDEKENFPIFHWFELCFTELPKRLFPDDFKFHLEWMIVYMNSKKNHKHPVDYLYEKFKNGK